MTLVGLNFERRCTYMYHRDYPSAVIDVHLISFPESLKFVITQGMSQNQLSFHFILDYLFFNFGSVFLVHSLKSVGFRSIREPLTSRRLVAVAKDQGDPTRNLISPPTPFATSSIPTKSQASSHHRNQAAPPRPIPNDNPNAMIRVAGSSRRRVLTVASQV